MHSKSCLQTVTILSMAEVIFSHLIPNAFQHTIFLPCNSTVHEDKCKMEVEQEQLSQILPQSSLSCRAAAPDLLLLKPRRSLRTAP